MPYKAYIIKQIPCCELLTWSVKIIIQNLLIVDEAQYIVVSQ